VNTTMIICIWVLNQAVSVVTLNGWRSIPDERWPSTDEHTMIFNQLGLSRKINLPRQGSIMSFLEIKIYKILEIY